MKNLQVHSYQDVWIAFGSGQVYSSGEPKL